MQQMTSKILTLKYKFHIPSWNLTVSAFWMIQNLKIGVMLRHSGGVFAFLSQCSSLELDMFQVLVCAHTHRGLHVICSILHFCATVSGFPVLRPEKAWHRDQKYLLLQPLTAGNCTRFITSNGHDPNPGASLHTALGCRWRTYPDELTHALHDPLWRAFKKAADYLSPQRLFLKNIHPSLAAATASQTQKKANFHSYRVKTAKPSHQSSKTTSNI